MAYAASWELYFSAGWAGVLPVPVQAKYPPPAGFTGDDGAWPSRETCETWAAGRGGDSIALRLPDGIAVLDVDHYDSGAEAKSGDDQLRELTARLGPLPATWASTARGDASGPGRSRQLFYQVPPGRYGQGAAADIDVLQRHHRYAVVWPSANPKAGGTLYRWYRPDGTPAADGEIPKPVDLPFLPDAWAGFLAARAVPAGYRAGATAAGAQLLGQLMSEAAPPCPWLEQRVAQAELDLSQARAGGRHDTAAARVYGLVQAAAEGHRGLAACDARLRAAWDLSVGDASRDAEYEGLWASAVRKALNNPERAFEHGGWLRQRSGDPCLMGAADRADFEARGRGEPSTSAEGYPTETPAGGGYGWFTFTFRGCIGADLFDPSGLSDDALARAALDRIAPAVRYVSDAGAWLVRSDPLRWEVSGEDMARSALSELTGLMPDGDAEGDKTTAEGTRLIFQAARKKKVASSAGAGGVARKMRDIATVPGSGYDVRLGDLDASPRILWAGGCPWDIEASVNGPVLARTDPGTPHLMSSPYLPAPGSTERWDRFCAAVWPDEQVRDWALNVLAVAFTGYAEKMLPILSGRKNRGKTQVVMLLMNLLGTGDGGYAHTADPRLLAAADRAHASIVMALKGRRLSFIDEAPRTGHLASERLKALTGGGDLTGNRMGENPVTFSATHTLILTANPDSDPAVTEEAMRERVRLLVCDGDEQEIRAARKAVGALDGRRWGEEAPAVLAAMLARAGAWMANPDIARNEAAPAQIAVAAAAMLAEQDTVLAWQQGETEDYAPGSRCHPLYEHYVAWCGRARVKEVTETAWGRRLTELGYPKEERRDGRYRALKLRDWYGQTATVSDFFSPGAVTHHNPLVPPAPSAAGGSTDEGVRRVTIHGAVPSTLPTAPPSSSSFSSSVEGVDGSCPSQEKEEEEGKEEVKKGGVKNNPSEIGARPPTHRTRTVAMEGGSARGDIAEGDGLAGGEPVVADMAVLPEKGEKTGNAKNTDSPPKAKTPRTRLSDEEKAERAQARKDRLAEERAQARRDKIAELGGPLVQLPAVVLRDQRILPVTPEQAAAWLEPMLGELSVDVEHSGFPVGHPEHRLRLVQLGNEHSAVVFNPSDPEQAAAVSVALRAAQALYAHSAHADLVPLEHAGLCDATAWDKMHDTVILAKLSDPALCGSEEAGLKALARAMLGDSYALSWREEKLKNEIFAAGGWLIECEVTTPAERSGWAQIPLCEAFVRYAASDVMDTAAVARVLS